MCCVYTSDIILFKLTSGMNVTRDIIFCIKLTCCCAERLTSDEKCDEQCHDCGDIVTCHVEYCHKMSYQKSHQHQMIYLVYYRVVDTISIFNRHQTSLILLSISPVLLSPHSLQQSIEGTHRHETSHLLLFFTSYLCRYP